MMLYRPNIIKSSIWSLNILALSWGSLGGIETEAAALSWSLGGAAARFQRRQRQGRAQKSESYMICALGGIQCNANVQDNMHNRQRAVDKKDSNAFFNSVKKPGWCCLDRVHKPLMAASSSTISVSQQATTWAVNNADRLTSFCAKRRARGCEMNQPTLPNCTRRQLMRSPRGSGGLRGAEEHLPWVWGGKEGCEARLGVLISLQKSNQLGNVQTKAGLTYCGPWPTLLVARRTGSASLWPSLDTHWLQQSSMPCCRQGASFTTQSVVSYLTCGGK